MTSGAYEDFILGEKKINRHVTPCIYEVMS